MNKALYLNTEIHAFGYIQGVYVTHENTIFEKLLSHVQPKTIFTLGMTTYKAIIILHEQSMNK